MAARAASPGIFWPTAFAAAAFVVLVGLGTWQVQRMNWKADLIEQVEAGVAAAPVSVADAEKLFAEGHAEYRRVAATGTFDHGAERHLYQVGKAGPGWHVFTPLVLADGRALWINRGYVPLAKKAAATRPDSLVEGEVTVTGYLREPERQGWFVPDNAPDKNEWFWRDLAAMAAGTAYPPLPFFIEAEEGGDPGEIPADGVTILDLPNRHFGYVLTWYGLAGTLLLVYVPFIRRRLVRAGDKAGKDHTE